MTAATSQLDYGHRPPIRRRWRRGAWAAAFVVAVACGLPFAPKCLKAVNLFYARY